MTLTDVSFRITRLPSFVVIAFTLRNFRHCALVKMMFFAKWSKSVHGIFNAIWRGNDKKFHVCNVSGGKGGKGLLMYRKFKVRLTHLEFGRFTMPVSKEVSIAEKSSPRLFTSSLGDFLTKVRLSVYLNGFRSGFPAAEGTRLAQLLHAQFLTRGRRNFCSQTGGKGGASDVEAFLPKGLELVKPVLFSFKQKWGKYVFQHFKDKGIRAVLIPCILQGDTVVSLATKFFTVYFPTITQVARTANVELTCNGAEDAVYARRSRNKGLLSSVIQWGHGYMPPKQVCNLGFASASNICKTATISPIVSYQSASCLVLGSATC